MQTAKKTTMKHDLQSKKAQQSKNLETQNAEKLSERETEILQQMANGLSSRFIGEALSISEDTVETHRKNIYRKIAARNAAEAMAYGFRNKLIT
jgi:DNA-binding NarL/FixJ family response regulator